MPSCATIDWFPQAVVEQLIDKAASTTRKQRTTTAYDQRDLPVRSTQQLTGSRTLVSEVDYDGNGNRTLVASPRAVESGV